MTTPHLPRRPVRRNALACLVAVAATAGCAAAAATPATSAGRAPDGTAGVACLKALTVAADARAVITKAASWPAAANALARDAAALRRIGTATTDDAAPEAIQDVADAVSAYANADAATDVSRVADLRTVALDAVQALQVICPVTDGGFESGTSGWVVAGAELTRTSAAHTGSWAALVTATQGSTGAMLTAPTQITTRNRTRYDVGLWARSDAPVTLTVQVTERRQGVQVGSAQQSMRLGAAWQQVAVPYRSISPRSTLTVQVLLGAMPKGSSVSFDDLWVLHH